ncbi:hypothetical protein FGRMN_5543 [Fusarium graminum]|nr:hypothetical protein FGRMN_5543 [Fusarium graminum]
MQLPLLSSLMVLPGTTGIIASGACYGEGNNNDIPWPGDDGNAVAREASEYAGRDPNGTFRGHFNADEERYYCVPFGSVTSFVFKVKNLNKNEGFELNDDDCALRLQNEINRCNEGGHSMVTGWWFSSDSQNFDNCGVKKD